MKVNKKEYDENLERLRQWFPKGSTVYTILRHVSRSGMSRTIGVMAILTTDGEPDIRHPNYSVSRVLGLQDVTGWVGDGVKISGCGMDMGFEIAYRLGDKLWGDGYALGHRWL